MPGQFGRTAVAVVLALATASAAQAQKGVSARVCSDGPARSLIAYLLEETAPHDRAGGLHLGQRGVGNGGCRSGLGLEQPRFLDAPLPADALPAPPGDVTSVVTGAISNPIAGAAIATGAAIAWVAAGAGVTTNVMSGSAAAAPVAELGATSVIVNPEPGTIVLVASGLVVAAAVARRRAR